MKIKKLNEMSGSKKFEMMKLFDCQDMPQKIRDVFLGKDEDAWQTSGKGGNDIIVKFYVYAEIYSKDDSYVKVKDGEVLHSDKENKELVIIRGNDVVSDWLYDNGGELFEEVLIKQWW